MFLGKNKYNIFSLFSLSDQGPSAASTHTSQYRGRGANLRGHKVCPNGDTAVSKLLRGHHERLIGRGRCPSAQWRRSSPVLRWQQLHYVHEGGGGQVRRAKKCQTSLTLYGLSFNNMVKKILLGRYRITIGNKTCVFEKENDPSLLRSPSAGKLIQFTVEDGGHLFAGQCYAEIEVKCAVFGNIYIRLHGFIYGIRYSVHIDWSTQKRWNLWPFLDLQVMKMVMTLTTAESGCIHYVKRAGAALEPGCVIAKLQLDDPSRVQQVMNDKKKKISFKFCVHFWPVRNCVQNIYIFKSICTCPVGRAAHWGPAVSSVSCFERGEAPQSLPQHTWPPRPHHEWLLSSWIVLQR